MPLVDWQEGMALGFGYDEVRGDSKQRAVVGRSAPPDNAAGQHGEFNLVLLKSAEEFDDALDISARVGGGFGLFQGSAKFGFKKRCKVSSQATFCALRVVAINAYEQLTNPELTEEAETLLRNGNMKRFRERFGDRFISGQVTGVEFYGVVRIEAKEVTRQQEIAAKIQASYGFFVNGGASVSFDEQMSSSEHRIEIATYQNGGLIQTCTSLPELFSLAKAALEAGRSGQAYPFEVMLDPYTELELPNDNASWIKTEAARRNVQKLAEHMWALQKIQNDIDFILRNQDWFESPDIAQLNDTNRLISKELNIIVEKADVCATDFDSCQAYSPAYPVLTIPPRKAGLSIPNLIGQPIDSASSGLIQLGLIPNPQPKPITETMWRALESQGKRKDVVYTQDPPAGTPTNPGARVQYSYYSYTPSTRPSRPPGTPIRALGRRRA